MRESLLKLAITSFLTVLVHFLSFGQNYIIHEGESWIEIADADDLRNIRSGGFPLDGRYLQTHDIDLSGFSENGGWPGIGSDNIHFNGIYNGQGFTIRNLTIDRGGYDQGLFAYVGSNGVLKNIRLTNVSVFAAERGIYVGALAGRNSGRIINCAAINGVLQASIYSGGLVGNNLGSGKIEQSYSGIDVSGTEQMGGLVGINANGGLIVNSYSQGSVTGEVDIGGLVGRNNRIGSVISNSFSSGLVNYEQNGGGLIGNNTGTVESSYWNIETSQQSDSPGDEEGKSDIEMKEKSTFVDWGFEDVWEIKEGESMPFLKSLGEFNLNKEIPELSFSINGTPVQSEKDINSTYGDRLFFIVESTSDGSLSDLKPEVSDASIIDISNFPEVRAINTGDAVLTIIQPETDNYESIEIYFNIWVGQKELRITPHSGQQKIYGEEEPEYLTFSVDNLEEEDTGLLSGGLKREEGENVGAYVIRQNDITAGGNYVVSLDTNIAFFKIIPREILITIDEKEKIYGELDPILTFQLLKGDLIEGDTFEGDLQRDDGENAGLYYISRGSLTAGSNYLLTFEDDNNFIIKRASSEIIAETNQVYVYDGTPKAVIASLNHEETLLSYLPDSSFVEAGSYQVQIHSPQTTNYLEASKDIMLTIHNATQEGIYLEDREYVYNGEERYLVIAGLTPEIENDTEITYINNGHSDAGLYEVTATIKRPNYEDLTLEASLTIHKAPAEIIAEPNQIHVYDGTPKAIIASLNHEETLLSYSPDLSFVEAGSYQVQIHSPQTTNYLGASKDIILTIHNAIQEGIYLEDGEYVYNGEERYLVIAGLTPEIENDIEITYINNGHSDAGLYEVTATIKRPNYEDLTLEARLTIHKAETKIIAEPNQIHIYDGRPKTVIASLNHEESKLFYKPIGAVKDAGVYEVEVYTEESRNFLKGNRKVILTIEKSILTVVVENTTKEFGENNPKFIINYKGFKNGENENVLTKEPTVNTLAATNSEIGEYLISPSDALSDNYDFKYNDGILTITPTDFGNITFENKTFVYNGREHSLIISNLPKDASIVYENNNYINTGNYLVKATISKPGYFNRTLEAELTIKKAPQVILFDEVGKVLRSQPYVELKAKSNVGLPIQLLSDDDLVASLNGHTLLIHRLGAVRVTASQKGDKNHEAAEPITILVEVEDEKQGPVRVHQALSPNGDGINDFLIVEGIKEFPENRIQIITPSGIVVFDLEGYDNEINVFKGISNRSSSSGSQLLDGTYFYMLRYKKDNKWESEKGWIYLKTQ